MLIDDVPFSGHGVGEAAAAGADFRACGSLGAEPCIGFQIIEFRAGRGIGNRRRDFNPQALRQSLRLGEPERGDEQERTIRESFHKFLVGGTAMACPYKP